MERIVMVLCAAMTHVDLTLKDVSHRANQNASVQKGINVVVENVFQKKNAHVIHVNVPSK